MFNLLRKYASSRYPAVLPFVNPCNGAAKVGLADVDDCLVLERGGRGAYGAITGTRVLCRVCL